jgi:intron-binding protein aquarius
MYIPEVVVGLNVPLYSLYTFSQGTLHDIASHLHLVPRLAQCPSPLDRELLLALLVARHERRQSQLDEVNDAPLYPTEEVLWDENVVPSDYYNGETCLALPKLNLQFLTLHDYLLRNYNLFRLESTYEIRENVEDVISRMKPWVNPEGITHFAGWARMALPITTFSIVEVGKPNVGENRPSRVKADITIELTVNDTVKREWEGIRKHDVCFVLTVLAKMGLQERFDWSKSFVSQSGVEYVRGCEVEGMLDENGRVMEEGPEPKPVLSGNSRTFRVWMDTNQYQRDMARVVKGEEDVYETFNVLMRRKPKENNFKAVLETIRALMNAECVVPDWLHDTFLGYGDPSAASYTRYILHACWMRRFC